MPPCFGASGSVRTYIWHQSANCPRLFHVFWPLMTMWSPSTTAAVRSEPRSEPASGSDIPWDQISSPRSMGPRNRSFCSWVPASRMAGAMLATPMTLTGPGAPAAAMTSR